MGLSEWEIIGFNILLLIAGNETTTNLLGNLLNVLADRPDLWQRLRRQPELIDAAIEETLRFDSPVQFLMREAKEDVELHGQRIAAGESVIVVMGSANRDKAVFDSPDEYLLDRPRGRHLSFGYGIHFCIGAPLARIEARIAMRALLDASAARRARQWRTSSESVHICCAGSKRCRCNSPIDRPRSTHANRPVVTSQLQHRPSARPVPLAA